MFDKFTDGAMKVIALARKEADRYNHEYIGTEHILLGMVIKEGSGVAATVLQNLGIEPEKIRMEIKEKIHMESDIVPMLVPLGQLKFTPEAKKILEYAIREAKNLKHDYIGTEHLFLGLLRERESAAGQILFNLGVKLNNARKEIIQVKSKAADSPKTTAFLICPHCKGVLLIEVK